MIIQIRDFLIIQTYQTDGWFIMNMLFDTYLSIFLYIWMIKWFPIKMIFCNDDCQMKIKKLNESDYEICTVKTCFS